MIAGEKRKGLDREALEELGFPRVQRARGAERGLEGSKSSISSPCVKPGPKVYQRLPLRPIRSLARKLHPINFSGKEQQLLEPGLRSRLTLAFF